MHYCRNLPVVIAVVSAAAAAGGVDSERRWHWYFVGRRWLRTISRLLGRLVNLWNGDNDCARMRTTAEWCIYDKSVLSEWEAGTVRPPSDIPLLI